MKIQISNQRATKNLGWVCQYNRSSYSFATKRQAVACARDLTSQNAPFTATVRPAKVEEVAA